MEHVVHKPKYATLRQLEFEKTISTFYLQARIGILEKDFKNQSWFGIGAVSKKREIEKQLGVLYKQLMERVNKQ